jgi:hypothetical protein
VYSSWYIPTTSRLCWQHGTRKRYTRIHVCIILAVDIFGLISWNELMNYDNFSCFFLQIRAQRYNSFSTFEKNWLKLNFKIKIKVFLWVGTDYMFYLYEKFVTFLKTFTCLHDYMYVQGYVKSFYIHMYVSQVNIIFSPKCKNEQTRENFQTSKDGQIVKNQLSSMPKNGPKSIGPFHFTDKIFCNNLWRVTQFK